MSIVAANLYRHGKLVGPVSPEEPVRCAADRSEFVWIGLFEPTEAELRQLQENYGLHPLAVEDALTAHQLPKVDVYGDQLFVVARTAHLADDRIAYGETSIFVSETFVISVRHGSARAHSDLRHQLEASPALLQHGVDYVLHAILDFIVDGYLPIVEAIEEEVLETEQRALDAFLEREEVRRLFTLRRELIRFQRVLGPMHEVCNKLTHLALPALDPDVRPYFHDVLDHVRREDRETPKIEAPTDAVIRIAVTLRVRVGPVAISRDSSRSPSRRRWDTSTAASSRRSAARSGR